MIGSGDLGMGISVYLMDDFSSNSNKVSNSANSLEKTFDKAAAGISAGVSKLREGFMGLLAAAAIAAPLALAINASAEFNHTLSRVGAVSNATAEEMVMLKNAALDLGSSTMFSAQQVAEAQTFLGMAGFSATQNIAAMPGVLNLAASASINLARASDIASDTLSMFSIAADDANRVADVMAKTTTTANTNMEQLFDGMRYLGPTAHALGISFEETAASIGLMADQGLKGSDATAALQTALLRLTKPTTAMSEAMTTLGVDFFDAQGEFVGIAGMVGQLEKAFVGLTREQQANHIATLFGARSAKQIFTLMNAQKTVMEDGVEVTKKGSEALAGYTESLMNSGGAAKEMADRINDNLKGSFIAFSSAVESASIRIGDALEPFIKPIVDMATEIVQIFNVIASHPIGKFIIGLASAVIILTAAFMAYAAIQTLILPGFIMLTTTAWSLAGAIWAALAPLWPFIIAGVALAGVIYGLVKGMQTFDEVLEGGEARTGFMGFLQKAGGIISGLIEVWKSWNGETFTLSKNMHDALESIGILDFVLNLGTWLVRVKEFFGGFMSGLSGVGSVISNAFGDILEAFGPLWDAIVDLVGLFFDLDGSIGKAAGTTEQWADIGKFLAEFLTTGLKVGIELVSISMRSMIGIITGVINAFTWLWDSISKLFSGEMSFAEFGMGIVNGLWEGIKSAWAFLRDGVTGLIEALPFGSKIIDFLGGETSSEGKDPGSVTGAGPNKTAQLMQSVNSASAMQKANEIGAMEPAVIDKSTTITESITTVVELDGEPIYKNMTDRQKLEDARR